MKVLKLCLLIVFMLSFSEVSAQHSYVHYFSVRGNVCMPLTIKTNKGTYTIERNGEYISGNINILEVRDGNGRKVLDTTYDRRSISDGVSSYWYTFEYLYSDSSNASSSSSNNSSSYSSGNNALGGLSSTLADFFTSGVNHPDDCYPNFTMKAGVSNVYGEFFQAKGCFGRASGLYIYGGIGRDFIFKAKDPDYLGDDAKKKMTWHAGLGFYRAFTDAEIVFSIDYADTPIAPNNALNFWIGGSWYFANDSHFGAFGGIGACFGNFKNGETIETKFGFEVGIAYRLF